ncbi:MAG: 3,4-dihydroxy-2-butanone-4-phosphate synthase [Planctomycetota bacterium]|nr:3,4-dihydroxy-2-butanone-4-phosphate synthase [Planctomycetota bacterium]
MSLASIPEIISELSSGRVVVLVDDENRENEGDFMVAAEFITPELVNFLTRVGGGYLCVALDGETCERLDLEPQGRNNTSLRQTPFTISVDGHPRHGVGTGISSADRAATIRLLARPDARPDDFVRPGHINPLRARDGGALVRTGQTEGSVDLCRLAGLRPAAAIIEVVKPDGEMARMPDLEKLCEEHDLKMCSVEQVIEYRLAQETLVRRGDPAEGVELETPVGRFRLFTWRSTIDALPHIALCAGEVGALDRNGDRIELADPTLVRVHRRDLLGDIFGVQGSSEEHSSREDLLRALQIINDAGSGALVYMRPESGNLELTRGLHEMSRSVDDVNAPDLARPDGIGTRVMPMDQREFGIGSQILRDLGLSKLRLITNHPRPWPTLHGFGLEVVDSVPLRD